MNLLCLLIGHLWTSFTTEDCPAPYRLCRRCTAIQHPCNDIDWSRFVTQYDEGSEGFFVDADEVQEVANQVNAALTQHDALISLLRRCSYLLWCAPSGSAHNDLAAKIDAYLSEIGNDA